MSHEKETFLNKTEQGIMITSRITVPHVQKNHPSILIKNSTEIYPEVETVNCSGIPMIVISQMYKKYLVDSANEDVRPELKLYADMESSNRILIRTKEEAELLINELKDLSEKLSK